MPLILMIYSFLGEIINQLNNLIKVKYFLITIKWGKLISNKNTKKISILMLHFELQNYMKINMYIKNTHILISGG